MVAAMVMVFLPLVLVLVWVYGVSVVVVMLLGSDIDVTAVDGKLVYCVLVRSLVFVVVVASVADIDDCSYVVYVRSYFYTRETLCMHYFVCHGMSMMLLLVRCYTLFVTKWPTVSSYFVDVGPAEFSAAHYPCQPLSTICRKRLPHPVNVSSPSPLPLHAFAYSPRFVLPRCAIPSHPQMLAVLVMVVGVAVALSMTGVLPGLPELPGWLLSLKPSAFGQ